MPSKSVYLNLLGDNKDAKLKLDEVDHKAEELAHKHPELKFGIDTAAASVKLGLLKEELKSVSKDEESGGGGFFGGIAKGLNKVLGIIPVVGEGLGGLSESAEKSGGAIASIGVSGPAIAVVAGAVSAAATEASALATGVTAAGLGLASFAVLGMPAFKEIAGAVGDSKKQLDSLSPPIRDAVEAFKSVKSEFGSMSKAFAPTAAKLFASAMRDVAGLMPALLPLAKSVVPGLTQGLDMLTKAFHGPMFSGFLHQMESLSGPVIKAVASGLIGLAQNGVRFFAVFSKKDVVNSINVAFRILGATMTALTWYIKAVMVSWDVLTGHIPVAGRAMHAVAGAFDTARHDIASVFDSVRHTIASWMHDTASAFDSVRHGVASMGHSVASTFDSVRHTIASWAADAGRSVGRAVSWFRGLPGRIVGALGNLGSLLWNAGSAIMGGLLHGIEAGFNSVKNFVGGIAGWISSHKGPISYDATLLTPHGKAIMGGLVTGLSSGMPGLTSQLAKTTSTIANTRIPAVAGNGGGGSRVTVDFDFKGGDQEIISYLKKCIRIRGGDPGVLGR